MTAHPSTGVAAALKVCVVGAGSVGGVIAAKLAATGHEVSVVARGAHLDVLRRNGLALVDAVDRFGGSYRLPASDEPADFGVQDVVVIGLKAHAIAPMLPRLRSLLRADTVVVPAINGLPWWYFYREGGRYDGRRLASLDPHGAMAAALDYAQIVGCVVHIAAEVRAPGVVHHTGGKRLILGEPDRTPAASSARLQRIAAALAAAGFAVDAVDDIRLAVWTKLIGNASFNPVAALTGYLMDQICADDGVLDVIRATMGEAMTMARHLGIELPMTVEQRIDLARQLGAAKISMLQDLEQGRPLELAAIVDAVIELAQWGGVAVPTLKHLRALVHARATTRGLARDR